MRITHSKDFYAGLIFILFGVLGVVLGLEYTMGTAFQMGPGYFPKVLSSALIVIGVITMIRSFVSKGERVAHFALKPLILILSAIVAFALLIGPFGLVIATLALIVISCLGGIGFTYKEVIILYIILVVFVSGLFVYGLKLSFNLWPS